MQRVRSTLLHSSLSPSRHSFLADVIAEKEQKMTYLNRLIEAVQFAVERRIDVKAAKIVAGLEAESTNALLQVKLLERYLANVVPCCRPVPMLTISA